MPARCGLDGLVASGQSECVLLENNLVTWVRKFVADLVVYDILKTALV